MNWLFQKHISVFLKLGFILYCIFLFECGSEKKAKLNFILPLSSSFVGAAIVESGGSTNLFEGTTNDTYTIVLNSAPTNPISISLNFDSTQLKINDSITSPVQINFTTVNWDQPQTISVLAVYDNIVEENHKSIITHSVPSGNPFTSAIQIGNVVANITDNQGSRLTSSFQSGTVTIGGINPLIVALTTTVDATKSYVYCNFKLTNSGVDRAITCQLSASGASISIQSGNAGSSSVVNWYVVEFSKGASVQRGSNSLLSTESTNTITLSTAVDLSRTFIIAYSRTTNTSNTIDEERTLRYRLTSTTGLEVLRNETGIGVSYEWQVIQLDGGRVQSGISTITNGSTSVSVTISSVNLSNSFIILNSAAGADVNGVETDHYVQASYASTTQVSFTRTGNSDTIDIAWFAIEMIDGTSVQSGNSSVATTSTFSTSTLATVDTTKTMIVSSYRVDTGDAPATTQDSGTFSSYFLDSSTIQFERASAESNSANISWFAVQFQ